MRQAFGVWLCAAAIAAAAGVQDVLAKPEYTRKTTKACAFCHQPPGYNLNDAGRYYADHNHSLKGFTPPPKPKPSH
jgi:cytochrome c553